MKLLLISDIHGNFEALGAALSLPHDAVICLGDVVDYGPDPSKCIDLLRAENILCVKGNHDNAVANGVDCGCGYTYKHLSVATREYTRSVLTDEQIMFLRSLPFSINDTIDGVNYLFTHGSPRSMYDYITVDMSDEEVISMFISDSAVPVDIMVVGHSHIQLDRVVGGIRIINPGSVGQRRDGLVGASCAILDTVDLSLKFFDLEYDVDAMVKKIRSSMKCSDELVAILKRGY